MATADKLNKILETKQAIRNAIIDKGVDVGEDVVFADYPAKISAIQAGGGDDFVEMRTLNHTNYSGLFYIYKGDSLDILGLDTWDTSNVTDMSYMFASCNNLTSLNLSGWNTGNVKSMQNMFANCGIENYDFFNNWDFSKVTTTSSMFSYAEAVNIDLSNWNIDPDISSYNIGQMFTGCYYLEVLDIRNLDATNCKANVSFINTFSSCKKLHTLRLDNCPNDTINKIITSTGFPTGAIDGVIRKIYINPNNRGDLTPPSNWIFVDKDTGEEIVIE